MNASTPSAILRYADLLEPVSANSPCGPDLEYDPAFVMLQAAAAPRSDAQYGDFVDVPATANWAEIERDCRALLLRTKDIRLATILLRCRTRQAGATGLQDGLAFVKAMLDRFGEALHPLPSFEGTRDPVMYANALAAMADPDGALGDARDIAMPKAAGVSLHLRDIEKSFATPRQKEALAPESTTRLLKDLWERSDATVAALVEAQRLADEIALWCRQTLGADAPDLALLVKLLHPFVKLQQGEHAPPHAMMNAVFDTSAGAGRARVSMPEPATGMAEAPSSTAQAQHQPIVSRVIPSRIDAAPMDRCSVLALLQTSRLWFEQNEPSSPVIVLLRQSERMVGKRFAELVHVIPSDLLAQWDGCDD